MYALLGAEIPRVGNQRKKNRSRFEQTASALKPTEGAANLKFRKAQQDFVILRESV